MWFLKFSRKHVSLSVNPDDLCPSSAPQRPVMERWLRFVLNLGLKSPDTKVQGSGWTGRGWKFLEWHWHTQKIPGLSSSWICWLVRVLGQREAWLLVGVVCSWWGREGVRQSRAQRLLDMKTQQCPVVCACTAKMTRTLSLRTEKLAFKAKDEKKENVAAHVTSPPLLGSHRRLPLFYVQPHLPCVSLSQC